MPGLQNKRVYRNRVCLAFFHLQAMSVLILISTVGAGDTFIAGMLFALISFVDDWTLERKIKFANELAGRKVVQEGFRGLGSLMQGSF